MEQIDTYMTGSHDYQKKELFGFLRTESIQTRMLNNG